MWTTQGSAALLRHYTSVADPYSRLASCGLRRLPHRLNKRVYPGSTRVGRWLQRLLDKIIVPLKTFAANIVHYGIIPAATAVR